MRKPRFAILGAAGHIARVHVDAIAAFGGKVVAVCDPLPMVGYLDRYFPHAAYFPNEDALHLYLQNNEVDYTVICTPSHLHVEQIRSLAPLTRVICEKPAALSLTEYDSLKQYHTRVNVVLQLRHLSYLDTLRELPGPLLLTYKAPRGEWYRHAWKYDPRRSGGVLLNIGVHAFDLLTHLYGPVTDVESCVLTKDAAIGRFTLGTTRISFDIATYTDAKADRSLRQGDDGNSLIYSLNTGATTSHLKVYNSILAGEGTLLNAIRPTFELIDTLKEAKCSYPSSLSASPSV